MVQHLDLNGTSVELSVYKMYNRVGMKAPTCPAEGRTLKLRFLEDIYNGTGKFRKSQGDGAHPLGYVIHMQFPEDAVPRPRLALFGISVKSAVDAWDSCKGLRIAFNELVQELENEGIEVAKADRKNIAELIGLTRNS